MEPTQEIKNEVTDFLKKNNTAVIATVWEGEPYASTIHYVADEDFNIYFLSHRNTAKYLNVSSHQRAAIVVGAGPKHISIQAKGIVDLLVGEQAKAVTEKIEWLKSSHIIEHLPIDEMKKFEDKTPVAFKFEPLEMTFMNLDDDDYPNSKSKEYWKIS